LSEGEMQDIHWFARYWAFLSEHAQEYHLSGFTSWSNSEFEAFWLKLRRLRKLVKDAEKCKRMNFPIDGIFIGRNGQNWWMPEHFVGSIRPVIRSRHFDEGVTGWCAGHYFDHHSEFSC
jgi:hypothetical protein